MTVTDGVQILEKKRKKNENENKEMLSRFQSSRSCDFVFVLYFSLMYSCEERVSVKECVRFFVVMRKCI